MNIKDYLEKHRMTTIEFCVQSKIGLSSIYKYMRGQAVPTLSMAIKIEKFTNGEVSVEELRRKK